MIGHAEVLSLRKNNMIMQRNLNQLTEFMNFPSENQILFRGQRIVAGMIVRHNKGTGIGDNQEAQDIPRMNQTMIHSSAKDHFKTDDFHT